MCDAHILSVIITIHFTTARAHARAHIARMRDLIVLSTLHGYVHLTHFFVGTVHYGRICVVIDSYDLCIVPPMSICVCLAWPTDSM